MFGSVSRHLTVMVAVAASIQPNISFGQITTRSPESIAGNFIANLKANRIDQAFSGFFVGSSMETAKPQEFRMLISQTGSAFNIYGPVSDCELVQTSKRGTLIESRLYLCQHEHFVTRWTLEMMHTKAGWTGGNIGFDEKFSLPLGQR